MFYRFNPKFILDIATLTGAIRVALGDCLTGAFTNDDRLWKLLEQAGATTGDRMWRMPLLKHYSEQMTDHDGHDLNNMGKGKGGLEYWVAVVKPGNQSLSKPSNLY